MKKFLLLIALLFMFCGYSYARNSEIINAQSVIDSQNRIDRIGFNILNSNGIEQRAVFDFDISRSVKKDSVTDTTVLGTVGYAAPEQFNNLKRYITSRADIFSLGVVVYECLSGRNPFCTSNNPNEILQNVLHLYPEPLHILGEENQELSSFILSMIQKQPSQRPRNATQALHWLQTIKTEIKI